MRDCFRPFDEYRFDERRYRRTPVGRLVAGAYGLKTMGMLASGLYTGAEIVGQFVPSLVRPPELRDLLLVYCASAAMYVIGAGCNAAAARRVQRQESSERIP